MSNSTVRFASYSSIWIQGVSWFAILTLGALLPTATIATEDPNQSIRFADMLQRNTTPPSETLPDVPVLPTRQSTTPMALPRQSSVVIQSKTALPPAALPETGLPSQLEPAIDETYALGAGDSIQVNFFNVPELSGEVRVEADGQMNLPWIGSVTVNRMTLGEVKQLLMEKYRPFLKRPPLVTLTLLQMRPVRVVVAGEVNRPGTYEPLVSQNRDVTLPGTLRQDSSPPSERRMLLQWPTLTEALQVAGGITQQADIRQVMVRRPMRGDRVQVMQADLWSLIQAGSAEHDITLRDGDVIVVPQAEKIDPAMAHRLGTASFSPRNIKVQVVGEVKTPGSIEVPTNSSLNQALLAAGGFNDERAQTSEVEFVRLNPDGTVDKRKIPVDLASAPNEQNNPIMRNNDVIVVQRSGATKVGDEARGFGRILTPFAALGGLLNLIFGF
jgi:polysaccharide export outer membrane protein